MAESSMANKNKTKEMSEQVQECQQVQEVWSTNTHTTHTHKNKTKEMSEQVQECQSVFFAEIFWDNLKCLLYLHFHTSRMIDITAMVGVEERMLSLEEMCRAYVNLVSTIFGQNAVVYKFFIFPCSAVCTGQLPPLRRRTDL